MNQVMQNHVAEITLRSQSSYANPFRDIELDVVFTAPDGTRQQVPAFWAGENTWKARFAPSMEGEYTYQSLCSNTEDSGLHGAASTLTATALESDNPLYRHGGLRMAADRRHLEHLDGTPFFWLADTWWMAFCKRLRWPDEFQWLTADRVEKGFTTIQIIAGLYPDMEPFDERGANEFGFPWDRAFTTIHPEYFDSVDQRVEHLVTSGLMPCIVGEWGYFMDFAGKDVLKQHWRYLIARYGAYPVVWCAAGEALMDYYLADKTEDRETRLQRRREDWSEMVRHIRQLDTFQRPVTIHPTQNGHEQVSEPELLDFDMLQTGHGGFNSLAPTVDQLEKALAHEPKLPVLVSEVDYEGIMESSREEIQRFHFWTSMFSGAMGHTYGANGLWQLNRPEQPYGPSPHGTSWGNLPWQDAANLPGSRQLGLGKKFLEHYPWWRLEQHPEWASHPQNTENRMGMYAVGIPGALRLFYFNAGMSWTAWSQNMKVLGLEEGITYDCSFFDPKTGDIYPLGTVRGGEYLVPKPPIFQDWVLVMAVESAS
ncbi:MAG: DUF4038 domain-containing protein [Anaerolineaceae bacterium]|nr:DUF4038 domain-containing protein [Anaerolineaceae bacterium]